MELELCMLYCRLKTHWNKVALPLWYNTACGQSGSACECFYLTGHKGNAIKRSNKRIFNQRVALYFRVAVLSSQFTKCKGLLICIAPNASCGGEGGWEANSYMHQLCSHHASYKNEPKRKKSSRLYIILTRERVAFKVSRATPWISLIPLFSQEKEERRF